MKDRQVEQVVSPRIRGGSKLGYFGNGGPLNPINTLNAIPPGNRPGTGRDQLIKERPAYMTIDEVANRIREELQALERCEVQPDSLGEAGVKSRIAALIWALKLIEET